jgi:hypothetical protein
MAGLDSGRTVRWVFEIEAVVLYRQELSVECKTVAGLHACAASNPPVLVSSYTAQSGSPPKPSLLPQFLSGRSEHVCEEHTPSCLSGGGIFLSVPKTMPFLQ